MDMGRRPCHYHWHTHYRSAGDMDRHRHSSPTAQGMPVQFVSTYPHIALPDFATPTPLASVLSPNSGLSPELHGLLLPEATASPAQISALLLLIADPQGHGAAASAVKEISHDIAAGRARL